MAKAKALNEWRRKTMRRLTRNTGKSEQAIKPIQQSRVKKILICRPNHRLGNMLLITPLVKEVSVIFPDAKIELFVKGGAAPIIFKHYSCIKHIFGLPKKTFKHFFKYAGGWIKLKFKRYDLVINAVHFSASGKIATKMARADYKFFGEPRDIESKKYPDYQHAGKYPVYALRSFLGKSGLTIKPQPVPLMDLQLSREEKESGKKRLNELVGNDKKSICIFTYATGKKCFSVHWWEKLYERLKKDYPAYNIVEVLPVQNVSQIGFKAPSFYSKDIREIGAFIAATEVFIGADSGMMHLSSAAFAPTIGLFSVTDLTVYRPYGNGSIAVQVEGEARDKCFEAIARILKGARAVD